MGYLRTVACMRCGLLLQVSQVAWPVCQSVCWSHGARICCVTDGNAIKLYSFMTPILAETPSAFQWARYPKIATSHRGCRPRNTWFLGPTWVSPQTASRSVCRPSLLSGRNVRWPRRMPLVSHGEYADGTDRQTDGRQVVTLRFPLEATGVIMSKYCGIS